jgi:tRNA pseudouridine55 synthase
VAIDGILNLDKPGGKTSFDMVARVRRISGEPRVGHGGTLDPDATGVLLICLGKATRMVEFLADSRKVYRAEVEFGTATDTYDATGKVMARGDASHLARRDVEAAAASFVGMIDQLPPAYSALKHEGVPLYKLARAGVDVPRKPRPVELFSIEVLGWRAPVAVLEVGCGKGTYIRSLAHDIGSALGCGAHLKSLVRLRSGPFGLEDSVSMESVEAAFRSGEWGDLLHPLDMAVQHLERVTLDAATEAAIVHGRAVDWLWGERPARDMCRAYGTDGQLVAILAYDENGARWRPRKVLVQRRA